MQPLDTEVGAGTFHPATFLRALGPEPWAAAYVQPSRRPTDGRYGENPNRLQHYYQYQVVMKPNPDEHPRAVHRLAEGARPRSAGARPALRRGQLGIADARRLGARLGSLVERHGSHPVHLFPAGRRPRMPPGDRRDHLRPRTPGDVSAERGQRVRPGLDRWSARRRHLRRRVPSRTKSSRAPTTSSTPTWPNCCAGSTSARARRTSWSRPTCRCRPTSR